MPTPIPSDWPQVARAAAALLGVTLACLFSTPARADDDLLVAERWNENTAGLSLRPPRGAERIDNPADGSLVTFGVPERYTIAVRVIHADAGVRIDQLKQQRSFELTTRAQVASATDHPVRPAGKPANLTYYLIRAPQREWVLGQLYVQLDDYTVASLELRSESVSFDADRKIFEALINSIALTDPAELAKIRMAWVRAGQRWRQGLSRELLKKAMVAEQWYRILDQGVDVGYTRVRHSLDTMMGQPGIKIEVDSRVVVGQSSFDSVSFFWESDDARSELWSVRTARRTLGERPSDLPKGAPPPMPHVVEETGVRSPDRRISVERAAPGDVDKLQWEVPPTGYISQVEAQIIPALLPRDAQQDFGFYAYSSNDTNLALRTIQVFPNTDGTYTVRERPAPDRAEQVTTYDARGRLIRRQMADGRLIVPATPDQMKKIWDIR